LSKVNRELLDFSGELDRLMEMNDDPRADDILVELGSAMDILRGIEDRL
jgi:hypothetical protein